MPNRIRRTSTTAAVLAAAAVVTATAGLAGASSASATTAETSAPAAATAPATRTSRMDIDGDGRRDTTTLTLRSLRNDKGTYDLVTKTARGARAATTFVVEGNGGDIDSIWWGAAGLDGTPGAEIVVNPSPMGDSASMRVYRWSNGRLVAQADPGATTWRDARNDWYVLNTPWGIHGYTFSTSRGARYVVEHSLEQYRTTNKYSGTHTTYRWNKSRATWQRVSTKRSGLISSSDAQNRYAGLFGVHFD